MRKLLLFFPVLLAKLFKVLFKQRDRLMAAFTLAACMFLFAGGFDWLNGVLYGCTSYEQYRNTMTAPLFGGFLIAGVWGLFYMYRHRDSRMCLFGLGIVVFSYGAMEWLFASL